MTEATTSGAASGAETSRTAKVLDITQTLLDLMENWRINPQDKLVNVEVGLHQIREALLEDKSKWQ